MQEFARLFFTVNPNGLPDFANTYTGEIINPKMKRAQKTCNS